MLNIHINNPELERSIRETVGDDSSSIVKAFIEFIKQRQIKQDVGVSVEQLDAGKGMELGDVMKDIRAKYE